MIYRPSIAVPIRTRENPLADGPMPSPSTLNDGTVSDTAYLDSPIMTPVDSPSLQPTPDPPAPSAVDMNGVELDLWPLASKEGLIIKIQPPTDATDIPRGSHVPCDVVLVIDVSGSMALTAPIPPEMAAEVTGASFSILDLVKHSARTISRTLNKGDRLGIVTYSWAAKVIQPLTVMDEAAQALTQRKINSMKAEGYTNMWDGILKGLGLFAGSASSHRVPALMVLTDGAPNHQNPRRGFIPKLRGMGKLNAPIHTFGFGYSLQSGLLKSIAEVSGGNYSFLPDCQMVGTVFIHAVANFQSTFAIETSVKLTYPSWLDLDFPAGDSLGQKDPVDFRGQKVKELTVELGNMQYGQSRDIYLAYKASPKDYDANLTNRDSDPARVVALLEYKRLSNNGGNPRHQHFLQLERSLASPPPDPAPAYVAYHVSRSMLCGFLASLMPVLRSAAGEHEPLTFDQIENWAGWAEDGRTTLEAVMRGGHAHINLLAALVRSIPARRHPEDADNASLMADIVGPPGGSVVFGPNGAGGRQREEGGQVALALSREAYWTRWGRHFMPSLLNAHAAQIRISFKDPGPLRYAEGSALFKACRDRLDDAFDMIPWPVPGPRWPPDSSASSSGAAAGHQTQSRAAKGSTVSMGKCFNNVGNGCFAGSTMVRLAAAAAATATTTTAAASAADGSLCAGPGGDKEQLVVPISTLRRGMAVQTPLGSRVVVAVLRARLRRKVVCRIGGLVVTPWHPIREATGVTAAPTTREPEAKGLASSGTIVGGPGWVFPAHHPEARPLLYTGWVYSVLLQPDPRPDAHAIMVSDGVWGVALGHGLVREEAGPGEGGGDPRAHRFFGSWNCVARELARLGVGRDGVVVSGGLVRSPGDGKVIGFRRPSNTEWARGRGCGGTTLVVLRGKPVPA